MCSLLPKQWLRWEQTCPHTQTHKTHPQSPRTLHNPFYCPFCFCPVLPVINQIAEESHTDLYVLANCTRTVMYWDEILRAAVRSFTGAVGCGFLLVPDNVQPHVTRVCGEFLDDEGIDAIDWPSHSPNLNPIQNLWDVMHWGIRSHQITPQTVQELTDALNQAWEETPFIISSGACLDIVGMDTGTWGPYTLLTYIMSWCDETHASWISLLFNFFFPLNFDV